MKNTVTKAAALALAMAPVLGAGVVSGGTASAATPSHVTEVMQILTTGKLAGSGEQPRITNSSWTVHKGQTVTIKIVSFDDGAAPLMGNFMKYTKVMGTVGGKEISGGKSITNVSDINVSHTFTIAALGFNMPIAAAPTGKSIVVIATFKPTKTGTFTWNCDAPCGTGTVGMDGAMKTNGWMTGKVKVVS